MKNLLLTTLAIVSVCTLMAQASKVTWKDLEKTKAIPIEIYTPSPTEMIVRFGAKNMFSKQEIRYYSNYKMSATGKISVEVNGSPGVFEGMELINGELFMMISDSKDKKNYFFAQRFNKKMEPAGKAIQLFEYELEKGASKYAFSYAVSENQKFIAVHYKIPVSKKVKEAKYGFKIFNDEFQEIMDSDFEIPFDKDEFDIKQYHISNRGDFFVLVEEFEMKDVSKGKKEKLVKSTKDLHLLRIANNRVEQFPLDMREGSIIGPRVSSNDENIFTLTGCFSESGAGIEGVFYLLVDGNKKKVIESDYYKFSKEFITSDWSGKQVSKAEKKADKKGKEFEPVLSEYKVKSVNVLKDNSVLGVMQQEYVRVVQTYNAQTKTYQTTYYYYFNDIIAFRVSEKGTFSWVTKIEKFKVSTNDGGPFSSYCMIIGDDNVHFYFNDHIKNYDPKRKYIAGFNPRGFATMKKMVFADAWIDLKSGKQDRTYIGDPGKAGVIAYPKFAFVSHSKKEAYIPARKGSMTKIGTIKL